MFKVRSAADVKVKEGEPECEEHGLETDYWFHLFEIYINQLQSFSTKLFQYNRCLDHSVLVCQHCLIFGTHKGDNAQTLEHRLETSLSSDLMMIKTLMNAGLLWEVAGTA